MTPGPADFGGRCLIGECTFDAELLLPSTSYFGLQKSGSYLYGTLRDDDGNLLRMLRAVESEQSRLASLFAAKPGGQLQRHPGSSEMWCGRTSITRNGDAVVMSSVGADDSQRFRFLHAPDGCGWGDGDVLAVAGDVIGPAIQWFNTWDGGACFSATSKYRVRGTFLGRTVEGFVGHEIHYFAAGFNWLNAPYGQGREICWQQVANEYTDGSMVQGTFAYGADGWGFAMLHDEHGAFVATTDVSAEATVRGNGYPQSIRYEFLGQSWTWRIDPQGERPSIPGVAMLGADGTCQRDGDTRSVRYSMGNSDWWTDGRADGIIGRGS
ncbi:hypothetical protein JF781_24235 [Mycobacterium sp. WUMAC-067]|uniref:hypothetical protein n=1 Tax=unclassified Mycobacterium TaxID=2642494 RepID=UPI001CD93082|nr:MULTISPECIES: hypothetical protein [unclassified Mycobacterium]MCA2245455.1 hypothetical protein [Mycobacterium sp. WUMAC-067]MCA2316987.1 hypothetical protein [Mycobacterium sp. WUMAC-025]